MPSVQPATDAEAAQWAQWLLGSGVDWWDLVRYGPPGFEEYVRISFAESDAGEEEDPAVRTALATLEAHTTTPDFGYAAVWEGWTGRRTAPVAPQIAIPQRTMLLFTGRVDALRDAPALAWYGSAQGILEEPHLVWPQDGAWCLACEVDEEVEFTVGCINDAAEDLIRAMPGAVRRVAYGAPAPLYRDPN
jgi:hypothetical protein